VEWKMRVLVVCLLACLASAQDLPDADTVNQLLDVVESGLDNSREGRQLFITLSLTSTATATQSITTTTTITKSCFSTASPITTCTATSTTTTTKSTATTTTTTAAVTTTTTAAPTTTTTAAAAGRKRRSFRFGRSEDLEEVVPAAAEDQISEETAEVEQQASEVAVEAKEQPEDAQLTPVVYQTFPEADVTRDDGVEASIEDILPTKALRSRFDMDAFDGVYVEEEGLSSGKIEWREVAVRGRSDQLCNARSAMDRRPRFIVLSTGTTTITSTAFSTVSSTAPSTVTFKVSKVTCTSSGFSFAVPSC